jgi:carbon-monoxide dehydrogenase medium subunit
MKPAKFEYERAVDVAGAIRLLASANGEGKALAGGQSLVPMMNLRLAQPGLLVDIRGLAELRQVADRDNHLHMGALVTHAAIEDGKVPDPSRGMMAYVARSIAYRAVRNRGTIGGSVVHADPAADWPTALTALGAAAEVAGQAGTRTIALSELYVGAFTPAIEPEEIVTGIRIPKLSARARWAYYKICRKPGEFADSIAAVVFDPDRNHRAVVLGATDGPPIRLSALAERLGPDASVPIDVAKEALRGLSVEFDSYELQIHAVAISRAVARTFAR